MSLSDKVAVALAWLGVGLMASAVVKLLIEAFVFSWAVGAAASGAICILIAVAIERIWSR